MGDDAAAAPLPREAVQGLAAAYSAAHPLVRHFQAILDNVTKLKYVGWVFAAVVAAVAAYVAVLVKPAEYE